MDLNYENISRWLEQDISDDDCMNLSSSEENDVPPNEIRVVSSRLRRFSTHDDEFSSEDDIPYHNCR